jgi:hypothetical protein
MDLWTENVRADGGLGTTQDGIEWSMAGLADFAGFMSQETVCAMTAAGGEFVMLESALTQIPFRPDPTSCLPQIAS